mmetsp:Transcript_87008/g.137996  ORF Transcript_87008/g.137996 Transcript_87008/m.137996 type:complete len:273 (+) Transcript_87008:1543-2361(+)
MERTPRGVGRVEATNSEFLVPPVGRRQRCDPKAEEQLHRRYRTRLNRNSQGTEPRANITVMVKKESSASSALDGAKSAGRKLGMLVTNWYKPSASFLLYGRLLTGTFNNWHKSHSSRRKNRVLLGWALKSVRHTETKLSNFCFRSVRSSGVSTGGSTFVVSFSLGRLPIRLLMGRLDRGWADTISTGTICDFSPMKWVVCKHLDLAVLASPAVSCSTRRTTGTSSKGKGTRRGPQEVRCIKNLERMATFLGTCSTRESAPPHAGLVLGLKGG